MFSAESEDLLASTRTCVFPVAILLATTLSQNKFEDVGDYVKWYLSAIKNCGFECTSDLQNSAIAFKRFSFSEIPIYTRGLRIWELPHLRHLELGNYYEVDPPNRNIEQLQTLSPGSCRNPTINLDYIRCLSKLETLTVIVPANSMTHLEQPVFSAGLKKLRLSGTNLPIMKLPWVLRALKVLKLENAFSGQIWGSFEQFSNLKLLLIEATNLQKWETFKIVPLHLRDLVFLRYLSIPPWFEGLDDVVSNNQNLQTVIVSGGEPQLLRTGHLSFRIWELPHLRHLELGNYYEVDPPNRNIEQLQTLSWVSPTHFTEEVYRKFPNLKYLKVFVEARDTYGYSPSKQYDPSRAASVFCRAEEVEVERN
nr:putative late blight resistance protein homolog R1B-23 [Ipomoea batatas]